MKNSRQLKKITFALLSAAMILTIQSAHAVTPPYLYGGSGQHAEGKASVYTTELRLSTGKLRMHGTAGAGGSPGYGLADSWGYFGIQYVTATQSRPIHAYTTVAYDGAVRISAIFYFFFGWARAGAWIRQIIRVYDTSTWKIVTSNTYWVYSETVESGAPYWENWKERVFNGNTDKYGTSVTFTATAGKTYAIETFVECQTKVDGMGLAMSSGIYNFWGPSQKYPNIDGYIKVEEISWYYT